MSAWMADSHSKMGIQALQSFIEANCPGACVPVDLLKIARSVVVRRVGGGRGALRQPFYYSRLCLVVDAECCLDRLYGGFFSDWVCGGQWNRMVQFLSVLIQTVQNNNIELAVFFNGGLEPQRMNEWIRQQQNDRKNINQVLKHVATKATPPPKVWWIPPVCLRTCLRMALRHLNVTVVCTMDDHHQEVIAFCRENNFHGLMAEDAEYAIFDPPRYFSSEQLKLTYKGSLETKEIILDEVAKSLNLHPNRFCIFAALLGNYLLTEEDLAAFHRSLCPDVKGKIPSETIIKAVVGFVRALPSIDNLDAIGAQVFGATGHDKIQKFKQCVQYYLNGTKDGFLRYRPTMQGRRVEPGCYPSFKNLSAISENNQNKPAQQNSEKPVNSNSTTSEVTDGDVSFPQPPSDSSKFASETPENELLSLAAYREARASYTTSTSAPEIVIDPPNQTQISLAQSLASDLKTEVAKKQNKSATNQNSAKGKDSGVFTEMAGDASSGSQHVNGGLLLSSSTSSSSSSSSPNRLSPEVAWSSTSVQQQSQQKTTKQEETPRIEAQIPKLPRVPPEVMRTASERHQKGLMSPWIYQVLSQGEIKIPVVIEDETGKELPSPHILYRPLRQYVYAILFNLHHMQFLAKQKREKEGKEEKPQEIIIKEWVWSKQKGFKSPDLVNAVPLGWAVPTVQRLWFGSTVDEKKRRLRAFLTCMRSDSPLMLNTSYVPQHLLVMCCVLRYIMSNGVRPILRKQELDSFLTQAVSPQLMNAQFTQNMPLPLVTTRGTQLAALFMQGVECALFANDACGAPIPWLMCCPWLFFDGKLFHQKLLKANSAKNLVEVCDGQIDQVAKVERMRTAILEGLEVEFVRPPLLPLNRPPPPPPPLTRYHSPYVLPGNVPPMPARGRGRGTVNRRGMIARGGQLEIAGVVVGSWGANYGQLPRGRSLSLPPQVASVGGMRRYTPAAGGVGRGFVARRPTMARIRRPAGLLHQDMFVQGIKKKPKNKKATKEKKSTEANDENAANGSTAANNTAAPKENGVHTPPAEAKSAESPQQQQQQQQQSQQWQNASITTTPPPVCNNNSASEQFSNAEENVRPAPTIDSSLLLQLGTGQAAPVVGGGGQCDQLA